MKDKFDEMYLKLSGANNFYKQGNNVKALSIYLDIIENYYPDKDEPYKHACDILMAEKKYDKAKTIANKALKAFREDNIRGSAEYFKGVLESIDQSKKPVKESNVKKKRLNILDNKFMTYGSILLLILSVLLSLPDKLNKLFFLIFILVSLLLVFEIIKDIKKNVKVTSKSLVFVVFIVLTLYAGYKTPKEEWLNFFSVDFTRSASTETSTASDNSSDAEKEDESGTKIVREDLDKLEKYSERITGLESYLLKVNENRIFLRVNVYEGTGKERAKAIAIDLLQELNSMKDVPKASGNSIGDLYDKYNVTVKAYEGSVMIYSAKADYGELVED